MASPIPTPIPTPVPTISSVPALPPSIESTIQPVAHAAPKATTWLGQFVDPQYYFDTVPFGKGFLLGKPLAIFFILLLIASFLLLSRTLLPELKRRAKVRGLALWLLFFGVAGMILLYFRRDMVPFLGMRLWLFLLLIGFIWWLVVAIFNWRKRD